MEQNKPTLEKCSFTFTQEGNCNGSTDKYEDLTIECESSLGIDKDEGCFYTLRTTSGWSINGIEELQELLNRIDKVLKK